MKKLFSIVTLIILFPIIGEAQEIQDSSKSTGSGSSILGVPQSQMAINNLDNIRLRQGVILSTLVPGVGQTYLGHPFKGAAFSIVFIGAVIGGINYQSNLTANNNRIQTLEIEYLSSGTYAKSEPIFQKIDSLHNDAETFKTRRTALFALAGIAWALNVADILFNTSDDGKESLVSTEAEPHRLALLAGTRMGGPALTLRWSF